MISVSLEAGQRHESADTGGVRLARKEAGRHEAPGATVALSSRAQRVAAGPRRRVNVP